MTSAARRSLKMCGDSACLGRDGPLQDCVTPDLDSGDE